MPIQQPPNIRGKHIMDGEISSRLIATDLQSDNYQPGFSGWLISRVTGNVEFNEGTFRGNVDISGDLVVSGENGILIRDGGDLRVQSGGDIIIDGGQIVAGPTTMDASGVRVGDDVFINSSGLQVIGGFVTPIWPFRVGDDASDVSLTTSDQTINSVVIDPPSWVQTLYLLIGHYAQMTEQSVTSRTLTANVNTGGGNFASVLFQAGTNGPVNNSSGKQATVAVTSFPVTINQVARVTVGTNGDNSFALSVMAFGIRGS